MPSSTGLQSPRFPVRTILLIRKLIRDLASESFRRLSHFANSSVLRTSIILEVYITVYVQSRIRRLQSCRQIAIWLSNPQPSRTLFPIPSKERNSPMEVIINIVLSHMQPLLNAFQLKQLKATMRAAFERTKTRRPRTRPTC